MSGPTTKAGRALLEEWYPDDGDGLDSIDRQSFRDDVLAIEQEAIRAERERIAAGVRTVVPLPNSRTFYEEGWVDCRAAVLALITPEDHDAPD